MQIALETQEFGNVYEDVPLVEGQEIKPSMFVDLDHKYMYVMTEHKVSLFKVIQILYSYFFKASSQLIEDLFTAHIYSCLSSLKKN